jgi:hypothetical protein
LGLGVTGCGPEPVGRTKKRTAVERPPLPLKQALMATVTTIESRADVPLGGHYLVIEPGDWMLREGKTVAVLSARDGRIVAFGGAGGPNGVVYLEPTAFTAFDGAETKTEHIESIVDDHVLYMRKRMLNNDLELHVWMTVARHRLTIATQVRSPSDQHALALTLGEIWAWSNTPTWVEGHGFMTQGGSYGGRFIARESAGIAYAACKMGGRLNARFSSAGLPGFHRSARTGEVRESVSAGGLSSVRVVDVAWSHASLGDAAAQLRCLGDAALVSVPEHDSRWIEVANCEPEDAHAARLERKKDLKDEEKRRGAGTPFARFTAARSDLAVPLACSRARLTSPGHEPGAWIDPTNADEWSHAKLQPKRGTLQWRVRAGDEPMPAKLVVTGRGKTKRPDWGEDLDGGAARNFVYTTGDGQRPIPPGKYQVRIHRGFEYSAFEKDIEVADSETVVIEANLERVVDTTGWMSADLHVHALPSWDAPVLLTDRVRSLAGVGVEVAVATDHNAVTDYAPAIEELGLKQHIVSIVGNEVTTEDTLLGHFNVFPLQPGIAPLEWRDVTPKDLFAKARALSVGGVIMVNHPRMGSIGYFELLHLDRGDVASWTGQAPLADMSFDAIEVFSGDHYTRIGEVRWVLDDWFALLNAGLRYTATGNSDSHKIGYQEAGMPRNWVAMSDDAPVNFDEAAFIRSVREGRVIVSSGPFVDFTIDEAGIGDTIEPGEVEARIIVDAPRWIDVSDVQLIRRGHVIQQWKVGGAKRPRFEATHTTNVSQGDWLMVIASGKRSTAGYYRRAAKPYAFTNPIWVR